MTRASLNPDRTIDSGANRQQWPSVPTRFRDTLDELRGVVEECCGLDERVTRLLRGADRESRKQAVGEILHARAIVIHHVTVLTETGHEKALTKMVQPAIDALTRAQERLTRTL
jgi:hypothetical protein